MQRGNLYDRPELYDLVAPADSAMERFYVDAALAHRGPVLDLACGSGRLSVPLARAGKEVVGADLSPPMLERGRRAADSAGVTVEFVELDMRDFDLPGQRFGTIIIAANSLLHLHDRNEFRGLLNSVARHLAVGGRLVFDVFVPNPKILSADPDERRPFATVTHSELGAITLEETFSYDPVDQISHITWFWSTEQEKDFWITPFELRQVFPQELPLLIEAGGMRLVERYGDFDRAAFGPQSWKQVCICESA